MPPKVNVSMEELRKVIQEEVRGVMATEFTPQLNRIEEDIKAISALQTQIADVEKALEHTSRRIDDIYTHAMPNLASHVSAIANALSLRLFDIDVHRRKWSLTLQGLPGSANESEDTTRTKCANLATQVLKLEGSSVDDFSACHRLKQSANSGIIVRFKDLKKRNDWLASTKNLKGTDYSEVSIGPDLPPALRPLKKELLNIRRQLPPQEKKKCNIRYLRSWPYVQLCREGQEPIRPTIPVAEIVTKALSIDPLLRITEPTDD